MAYGYAVNVKKTGSSPQKKMDYQKTMMGSSSSKGAANSKGSKSTGRYSKMHSHNGEHKGAGN